MIGGNIGEVPPGAVEVVTTPAAETAAFDELGPRARAALNHASFRWSAITLLQQVHDLGRQPTYPATDALVAAYVEREDAAMLARENQRRGLHDQK